MKDTASTKNTRSYGGALVVKRLKRRWHEKRASWEGARQFIKRGVMWAYGHGYISLSTTEKIFVRVDLRSC